MADCDEEEDEDDDEALALALVVVGVSAEALSPRTRVVVYLRVCEESEEEESERLLAERCAVRRERGVGDTVCVRVVVRLIPDSKAEVEVPLLEPRKYANKTDSVNFVHNNKTSWILM